MLTLTKEKYLAELIGPSADHSVTGAVDSMGHIRTLALAEQVKQLMINGNEHNILSTGKHSVPSMESGSVWFELPS